MPLMLDHAESVLKVSPDGRWLATNTDRGFAAVALSGSGSTIVLGSQAQQAAFTPDTRLLVAVGNDGVMRSWHVPSFAPAPWSTHAPFAARLDVFEISPVGDRLVTIDRKHGATTAWNIADGSLARELGTVGYY